MRVQHILHCYQLHRMWHLHKTRVLHESPASPELLLVRMWHVHKTRVLHESLESPALLLVKMWHLYTVKPEFHMRVQHLLKCIHFRGILAYIVSHN